MKVWIKLIFLALLLAGCGTRNIAPDPNLIDIQTPKPVILDVDMAHENMFSALLDNNGLPLEAAWQCRSRVKKVDQS